MLNYVLTNVLRLTASNIRWLDSRWGGLTVAMMLGIWKGIRHLMPVRFGYAAALSFIVAVTLILLAILQFKAMQQGDSVE